MMNDSEMNLSFWENTSHEDNQTQEEFPQWRPVLSLLLLGFWLLSVLLTSLLTSSVLLVIIVKKSSFNQTLATLHIYALVLNIFVRASLAMTASTFIPPAIRFCECSIVSSSIFLYLHLFNICYQTYTFVSLGVFQFLIIKGKNKLLTFKIIAITLTIVTIMTIIVPLIFISVGTNDGGAVLCGSTIGCAGFDSARLLAIFASFHVTNWVPSLSILVVVTAWSCAIFKKNYAGRDAGLNRRIIAIPLLLPMVVTAISIATFASYRVVDFIILQTLSSNSFSRNWNTSFRFTVVLLNEIASGLSYPCLILFLHPKLRNLWKMLFNPNMTFWKNNQVTPT